MERTYAAERTSTPSVASWQFFVVHIKISSYWLRSVKGESIVNLWADPMDPSFQLTSYLMNNRVIDRITILILCISHIGDLFLISNLAREYDWPYSTNDAWLDAIHGAPVGR